MCFSFSFSCVLWVQLSSLCMLCQMPYGQCIYIHIFGGAWGALAYSYGKIRIRCYHHQQHHHPRHLHTHTHAYTIGKSMQCACDDKHRQIVWRQASKYGKSNRKRRSQNHTSVGLILLHCQVYTIHKDIQNQKTNKVEKTVFTLFTHKKEFNNFFRSALFNTRLKDTIILNKFLLDSIFFKSYSDGVQWCFHT